MAFVYLQTDRIPEGWLERLNSPVSKVDEIWVPTQWMKSVFAQSGAQEDKLFVLPETVDIYTFNRSRHSPLPRIENKDGFKFLSVFKWEHRKGWDILLKAFYGLLTHNDYRKVDEKHTRRHSRYKNEGMLQADPTLYLLASTYHNKGDFHLKVQEFLKRNLSCAEVIRQVRYRFEHDESASPYYLRGYDFGDSWWCVDFDDTDFEELPVFETETRLKFQTRPSLQTCILQK